MNIINLTPHSVNIIFDKGCTEYNSKARSYVLTSGPKNFCIISPSGNVARCSTKEFDCGFIPYDNIDIPILATEFGNIIDLPAPVTGTFYIVSSLVASAGKVLGRNDLLVPSRLVRNEEGAIIGCLALSK